MRKYEKCSFCGYVSCICKRVMDIGGRPWDWVDVIIIGSVLVLIALNLIVYVVI